MKQQLKCLHMIGLMNLQLQRFVYDRVDETTATNVSTGQGLMKQQLQMIVQDRVDETTAINICIGQG